MAENFDVNDYFRIVDSIIKANFKGLEQISLRTEINRLYYGIINILKYRFKIPKKDKKIHKDIKEKAIDETFSYELLQLEELRVKSDYQPEEIVTEWDYKSAIDLKNKILVLIGESEDVYYEKLS